MLGAVRSEFRKFFTTRMWWGMAIGIFLAGGAFAALFAFALTRTNGAFGEQGVPTGSATQIANTVYTGGINVGLLLMLTIGVMQIGSEYRHKTISGTFLATPKRLEAMLAKVVALLGIGVLYGLISLVGSFGVGAIVLHARGHAVLPSNEVYRSLALSLLVLGLWALIGLGIGILIPNHVAALLIGIGVAWIVEPIITLVMGLLWTWGRDHVVPYMPSQATSAVINGVTRSGANAAPQLSWWAASLVLVAWAAALSGFGIWRTTRQDIS